MKEETRKTEKSRIRLSFLTGSELTKETLKTAVEYARGRVDATDRAKIGFAPPIKVKPPLPALGFASGCASFIVPLLKTLMKTYAGGLIIDLREQLPLISRDPHLPRQMVEIVVADGTSQIKVPSLPDDALASILEDILRLPQSKGEVGVTKDDVERLINSGNPERARAGIAKGETTAA